MTTITPFLWFDDDAEAALDLYTSLFPDSRVLQRSTYGPGMPQPAGTLMSATIELVGQTVMLLNGGPSQTHSAAFSFFVLCADQAEVDRYWHGLIDGGGEPGRCGWLVDRFGLSWQIIPQAFVDYTSDRDGAKVGRVMQAMLAMQKMDVAAITAAYEG
jgi:predicted 3-demethylubiquinone-9 3-methyltransferase (glyoxalase superfamily)